MGTNPETSEILHKELTYDVMGACFEVHNSMGPGFLETVYQECLQIEFAARLIPFAAQVPLGIAYKGQPLAARYVPDFVIDQKLIVEIKALSALTGEHRAQTLNYLRATGYRLGLLINFGSVGKLESERLVL